MNLKIESIDIKDIGTLTSQIQYIVKACTTHPNFRGEQIVITFVSNNNESLESVRSRLTDIANSLWTKLAK